MMLSVVSERLQQMIGGLHATGPAILAFGKAGALDGEGRTATRIAPRQGLMPRLLSAMRGRPVPGADGVWTGALPGLLDAAILGVDAAGVVAYWSGRAATMFGYAAGEIVGRKLALLDGTPGTDLAALALRAGPGAIPGADPGADGSDGNEAIMRRRDGGLLTVVLAGAPVRDARQRRIGTAILVRDVTGPRRIAAELGALRRDQAALSRLTAVEQVSATLAHELNQPLAAIVNYARAGQLLLAGRNSADPQKLAQALDGVLSQSLRAGRIIARLRGFIARGEADKRVESLSSLIDETVRLALPDFGLPDGGFDGSGRDAVHLVLHLDPAADLVLADRVQVQQVLLNLIRNAVQAMQAMPPEPAGKVGRRALTIDSRLADGMVAVSVTDSGPGIPAEIADRLFEPFVTTRPDGTGLGLTICNAIVGAHGGTLTCLPAPCGGTVFRFTLTGIAEPPP